ncbi:hypothetical protein VTI28DRAFT_7099 [Corynascus sepedonium]
MALLAPLSHVSPILFHTAFQVFLGVCFLVLLCFRLRFVIPCLGAEYSRHREDEVSARLSCGPVTWDSRLHRCVFLRLQRHDWPLGSMATYNRLV